MLPELVNEHAAPLPGPPGRLANHINGARPRTPAHYFIVASAGSALHSNTSSLLVDSTTSQSASADEPLPPSYQRRRPEDYVDENDLYREVL